MVQPAVCSFPVGTFSRVTAFRLYLYKAAVQFRRFVPFFSHFSFSQLMPRGFLPIAWQPYRSLGRALLSFSSCLMCTYLFFGSLLRALRSTGCFLA